MDILGVNYNKKKFKIFLVVGKKEEENLNKLLFLQLSLPDRIDFSFHRGDSEIIYQIRLFSRADFNRMRNQLKNCLR